MSMGGLRVGLCGVGTVGLATVQILRDQSATLAARCGQPVSITHVGARREVPHPDYAAVHISRDVMDVARDPDVDVLVELIGGTTVARDLIKLAIEQGKHVVTANKALIAEHGNELILLAEQAGVQLRFEAAVAGGIPIIKTLREALAANEVSEVAGIINGTGNFILTEMSTKGRSYEDVLAEAQALGYAEADPTFDVDGTDAAHKLVILASLAFGLPLDAEAPFKQGIQAITPEDLEFAASMGYRVKHLGIARRQGDRVEMRVHPTLIPEQKQLANVDGVLNAVMVKGDAVGELVLVGPGAGGAATASAVCADLADIARNAAGSGPALGVPMAQLKSQTLVPADDIESEWYVRLTASDCAGVMSDITQVLANHDVSIESLLQNPPREDQATVSIVLLTHVASASVMTSVMQEITALTEVETDFTLLRVEAFDQ